MDASEQGGLPNANPRGAIENEAVDAAQIAVPLGIVHAAADDELIGDVKPDISDRQVESDRRRLAQQGADGETCRPTLLQRIDNGGDRAAGVENVLDDEHVAAGDIQPVEAGDRDRAGGAARRAIGGGRDDIECARRLDFAHQIGGEDHGALQHHNETQPFAAVIGVDVAGKRGDAGADVAFGDQQLEPFSHVVQIAPCRRPNPATLMGRDSRLGDALDRARSHLYKPPAVPR